MKTIIIAIIAACTLTGCGRALTWDHAVRGEFVVEEKTVIVEARKIWIHEYEADPIIAFWVDGDEYRAITDAGFQKTQEWRWYQTEGGQWMLEKVAKAERVQRGVDQAAHMVAYRPGVTQ